jgi:L-alanine-DL-glutamate epimerase-like enolase superfamily enzyme
MKIVRVEPILLNIPFDYGARGHQTRATMQFLFVRVDTDAGVSGWGEAFGFKICPATHAAITSLLAPAFVGHDPGDIAGLMGKVGFDFKSGGRSGPVQFGLSGIDIALWDIAGKVAGKPVHALLGGKKRDRVGAYASLNGFHDAQRAAANAAQALTDGYREVKLHERDTACIAAARAAVGAGTPLMVDVNCVWKPDEALAMAREWEPYELTWLEEPVWPPEDHAAMKRIRSETRVPVSSGENAQSPSDLLALVREGIVDVLQPDVIKFGGITDTLPVMRAAAAAGVRVSPHSPYIGPGLIASIHLSAVMDEDAICERFYLDFDASPLGSAAHAANGTLPVPDGPGLGVTVDDEVIARYRVA